MPGNTGRNHDDIRAGRLFVAVRADHARVEPFHRGGLPLVEAFPLRDAFDYVHHHHRAAERLLGDTLRRRGADIARAYDRDLVDHVVPDLRTALC
jgi:hypothetical protein